MGRLDPARDCLILSAQGDQLRGIHLGGEGDRRRGVGALRHPLADDPPHPAERLGLTDRRGLARRRLGGGLDVGSGNPLVGHLRGQFVQIDPLLLGDSARHRAYPRPRGNRRHGGRGAHIALHDTPGPTAAGNGRPIDAQFFGDAAGPRAGRRGSESIGLRPSRVDRGRKHGRLRLGGSRCRRFGWGGLRRE